MDWEKRDEECLELAKEAVKRILTKKVSQIGAGRWFEMKRLVKTHKYLEEVSEDINNFRIRKIRWTINKMIQNGLSLTPYKIKGMQDLMGTVKW